MARQGRKSQPAPPSKVFHSGCKALDSILRDDWLPYAQDPSHLGPFTQYPPTTAPVGPDCPWQVVNSGEELSAIMAQPEPRVKLLAGTTPSGNYQSERAPPMRVPPQGIQPAPGTIAFLKGNGVLLDMTQIDNDLVPFPPLFNNTEDVSVRVMWDWHMVTPNNTVLRLASLAFSFNVNYTETNCNVRAVCSCVQTVSTWQQWVHTHMHVFYVDCSCLVCL
jgi:hypothetical protein